MVGYFCAAEQVKRVRSVLFRIEVVREGQKAVSAIWYEPDGYDGEDKLPVFVCIHGDAWISTDAVDVDTYMQDIAGGTPCKVVEGMIDCETKQRSS